MNFNRWLRCMAALALLALGACSLPRKAARVPIEAAQAVMPGKPAAKQTPMEIQEKLLRFADEFSSGFTKSIDSLRRGTNVVDQAESLRWKIGFNTEINSIASGQNAMANLLDMTAFVTVLRKALEEHGQAKIYGDSALPMIEACKTSEAEVWRLAGQVLSAAQVEEFKSTISAWSESHPSKGNIQGTRAVGLAFQVAPPKADPARTDSVFNLLLLDPLASIDPATKEIAALRLFAERALHVTRRMPMLLRWQSELLLLDATSAPAVAQLVTNSTQLTAAIDQLAGVAEKLPRQISAEREEILKALESQEKTLRPLIDEVKQTLAAGEQMSTSLNTTFRTFDALMKRFGVGETNAAGSSRTNAEPFRIQDYSTAAAQLGGTAQRLTELLVTLDRTAGSSNFAQLSGSVAPAIQQAQTGGKELVNYVFWKAILLVGIVFIAAVAYRFIATRLVAANRGDSR